MWGCPAFVSVVVRNVVSGAEAYRQAGATTFIVEIAPDPTTGYDTSALAPSVAMRLKQIRLTGDTMARRKPVSGRVA